ncbi:MAG: DNA topoisomerase I [Candidatus Niyogibacteria bacterium RIFCSPLOWO2_12_FULL_41_13]|uniref:DNA topoisomerase 1 n=1 Tax=Candidatus Niyogibacteria bacterium RIFCSPLOWO2_12_FULL_41_13 TaxID=1801726 RepID=A0A1G2F2Z7_9BACT|nr:MAG: DNA topoisomerase I [Candidatus Niyogibacteria bacterium RIFCSPLOWO2_12_FULL_41_13]
MKLVIVESPTKAKTIGKFLGADYKIESSYGHIRDLPKSNKNAIDIPGGFIPRYEISKGKEKVAAEIGALAQKADEILLATDPDREGEAISWHIIQACGLGDKIVKRIVFHEITKLAIEEAIKHPRGIDENLRKAQEARRVLDRLVGYDLSGLIWKKVRYGLSAGRVQSPALRIIMEREREIRAFTPENYWVITGEFKTAQEDKIALICEEEPRDEKETNRILEIGRANQWRATEIKQSEVKRSPYAPFTTSTLQQAASSRLGYSPSRAMSIAQKLYEQGFITYMRTDSVTIGKEALGAIHKEIEKTYGREYCDPRAYKTKSKSAQEAHEAIRPTNAGQKSAGATDEQKKLYKLIWERTISSQMADAKIFKTKVSANVIKQGLIPDFSVIGSRTVFLGWLAADKESQGKEVQIPELSQGEALKLLDIASQSKQTEPPGRYTEAGLVKELEKREIGRPSTYASIIKTINDRGYVLKEGRVLRPTDTGEVVSGFLENNFAQYISDSFTAEMENELDEIAEGKRKYEEMLKSFYIPFSKEVKSKEKIKKLTNLGKADEKFKCPVCGGSMVIKLSKTGKFLSCEKFPKCAGARKIDGVEIEGPKETGEICPACLTGKLMEREGRFGKFISCGNYPKCKFIKKSAEQEARAKTGVSCPKCLPVGRHGLPAGEILERRGRFGLFYSCSNYPKCDFIMRARPTGRVCGECGSLMMEGAKTIPERCSNKSCPNHNPHKK